MNFRYWLVVLSYTLLAQPAHSQPEPDLEFELADTLLMSVAKICSDRINVEKIDSTKNERSEKLANLSYQLDTTYRTFFSNNNATGLLFSNHMTSFLEYGLTETGRDSAKAGYVEFGLMSFAVDYKSCADLAFSPVGFVYLEKLSVFHEVKEIEKARLEAFFDEHYRFKGPQEP